MEDKTKETRKIKLIDFFNDKEYNPMTVNEIAYILEVPAEDRDELTEIINELVKEGKAVITKKGKLISPEAMGLVYGNFIGNVKGFGFVVTEKFEGDIFIPPSATNGAMHKDKVLCRITSGESVGKRKEGEIVQVLERGMDIIVGTYQEMRKGTGFVLPDDKKISNDIYIPTGYSKGAVNGHKVVVKITKPAIGDRNPEGRITDILGHRNDPGVDILSIVIKHGLATEFPEEVYDEVEKIKEEVEEKDLVGREDLRDLLMVTIDGEDSKDLDDAVSLEILENGNYRLGVHIADVSHYVREGTPLDKEALKRGTSVYLVDRVIPMLPHILSNGICSLNPDVDRLALSCIMDINRNGEVLSHRICESVIKTNRRMTYTIVNDILTNPKSEYRNEYSELLPMFLNMGELSVTLRDKRIKRGAIEFGFTECKIILDEKGKPIDIKPYLRNSATSLIEEFMLICNETVAEEYFWLELPFVYRTHEEPDPEKIQALSEFINKFGFHIKGASTHPKSIQKLLASVENKPEEIVISKVALRSLKQARYTVSNDGHFGLAAKYYSHFTSPIRRYPDLQIHRIIKSNINGVLTEKSIERLEKNLPEVCALCSKNERIAEYAERDVDSIKKAQYMADKIGESFSGIISGVTSWGLYVELPNTVEGMISINDLEDDYYIYDEKNMCYIGEHRRKTYNLGDKVTVILDRVNLHDGKIDFLIDEE